MKLGTDGTKVQTIDILPFIYILNVIKWRVKRIQFYFEVFSKSFWKKSVVKNVESKNINTNDKNPSSNAIIPKPELSI